MFGCEIDEMPRSFKIPKCRFILERCSVLPPSGSFFLWFDGTASRLWLTQITHNSESSLW